MRVPQFWAGMGRAVNNLCAILIGSFSVALIRSGDSTKIMIASIGLFVLISIAIYIYTMMGQTDVELPDQERKQEEEQDYFSAFAVCNISQILSISLLFFISFIFLYTYIKAGIKNKSAATQAVASPKQTARKPNAGTA